MNIDNPQINEVSCRLILVVSFCAGKNASGNIFDGQIVPNRIINVLVFPNLRKRGVFAEGFVVHSDPIA
jgi:hypothetical protein